MLSIALAHRPHAACIVPEKREERTTEGGLDAAGQCEQLAYFVDKLGAAGIILFSYEAMAAPPNSAVSVSELGRAAFGTGPE